MATKIVFVTVGTTSFDKLVETVISPSICKILRKNGYKKLLIQTGRGNIQPATHDMEGIRIESYRYKDSIQCDIETADLIISHAGAGSCLEVLGAKKPLVVVINEELMGNHQTELAAKLHTEGYLLYGTCRDLAEKLDKFGAIKLTAWEPGRPEKFAAFIDKVMGVS